MPLFKGTSSKAKPHKAIEYITNPNKAAFVDTVNMVPGENYAERFIQTANFFGKNSDFDERKYYHFKFSPDVKDNVSPESCQAAALELAKKLFPGHECVVATHVDTGVVHSHIVINSVSFETGKKLRVLTSEYAFMKDYANEVGRRYGMTPLDWRNAVEEKRQSRSSVEQKIILRGGTSWKEELREVIDLAKAECDNIIEFEDYLADYGITLPRCTDETISYLHPNRQKPVRGSTLGKEYTSEAIDKCFFEKEIKQEVHTVKYLKELLDMKHTLVFSDAEWARHCNMLTNREEVRLFLRNTAIDSTDEQAFLKNLEENYGLIQTQVDGEEAYIKKDTNEIFKISDLGNQYSNRKEIISNVIGEQTYRAYSSRAERTVNGTGDSERSLNLRDGERRVVNATSPQQTANVKADGEQNFTKQDVSMYGSPTGDFNSTKTGNSQHVINVVRNSNPKSERVNNGALQPTDNKLSNNRQNSGEINGRK